MARKRARTAATNASSKKKKSPASAVPKAQPRPNQITKEEQIEKLKIQIAVDERITTLESRMAELNAYQTKYNTVLEFTLAVWARAVLETLHFSPPSSPAYVDDDSDDEVKINNEEKTVHRSPQAVMLDMLKKWGKAIGVDSGKSDVEVEKDEKDVKVRERSPCPPRNLSQEERLKKLEVQFALISLNQIKCNKIFELMLSASAQAVGVNVEALPSFPLPPAYVLENGHKEEEEDEESDEDEDEED